MGLIILGVSLFLARDLRDRFENLQLLFNSLDKLSPYARFIAPGCVMVGLLLMLVALLIG